MIGDLFRLDGRTVLVTGGAGLYGVGICRGLAEMGAHVVLTSRDEAKAEVAAGGLRAEGLNVVAAQLDQTDEASITQALDASGPIDVLINNAVERGGRGLFDTTAEQWRTTSETNSLGLFLLTQAVAKGMVERGDGSIINIGSIYGIVAPTFALYEGTDMTSPAYYAYDKAGMLGFTRWLAAALGPHGVRANCVAPGGLHSGQDEAFIARYESRTPLRRMATGTDVLGAIILLASPAGAYITGQTLAVDGGFTAL